MGQLQGVELSIVWGKIMTTTYCMLKCAENGIR